MGLNLGDKERSVTVRLTAEQYDFLAQSALALEVTPSKFLRMVINATMTANNVAHKAVNEVFDEHAKADFDHLLEQ